MSDDICVRLRSIKKKIDSIEVVISCHGGIVATLEDEDEAQPAILMLLVAISEQFQKIQKQDQKVANVFGSETLKGIVAVHNFIAHDYDGINLAMIENGLRYEIPRVQETLEKILEDSC